ncbi:MAG: PD-(D/E)XK nuclease family protein [Actinomycetota bacterium]
MSQLNEAQQRVVDELGATAEHRPTFPDGLAVGLRHHLKEGLAPITANLPRDESVFVSKFLLSQVLGCEARHLHELRRPFAWSVPVARGTVAHKAIELSVHWRTVPIATELVDEAIGSLSNDGSPIADYLRSIPEVERAQLRSEAANSTQAFLDGFPPLRAKPQWRPAVEVRGRYECLDGAVVLSGKVDLSLGGPSGDRSGRVFIDLKTGRRSHTHREDLRYYALIETVRYGTPPRALASYYLDESRLSVEHVTADVLWSASDRVIGAVERHLTLLAGEDTPLFKPSIACRWCPLLNAEPPCEAGNTFLDATDEDELEILS